MVTVAAPLAWQSMPALRYHCGSAVFGPYPHVYAGAGATGRYPT
jgi:hypothetical protein